MVSGGVSEPPVVGWGIVSGLVTFPETVPVTAHVPRVPPTETTPLRPPPTDRLPTLPETVRWPARLPETVIAVTAAEPAVGFVTLMAPDAVRSRLIVT